MVTCERFVLCRIQQAIEAASRRGLQTIHLRGLHYMLVSGEGNTRVNSRISERRGWRAVRSVTRQRSASAF
jgi:hypothetical protein